MTMKLLCAKFALLAVGLAGAPVWSQDEVDAPPDRYAIEHQRIEVLRDQRSKVFDAQEQACTSKFAVTDCQSSIKAERRKMLAELKHQDVLLNAEQRKEKADEQLKRNADKATDNALQQADTPTANNKSLEDRQKEQDEKVLNHKNQAHTAEAKAPKSTSALDAQTIEKNRQAYADKLKELERRRQERDKTVREHGTSGPPLPPAPL